MGARRSAHAFDGLIVDLDGVVWVGEEPIHGSAAALRELQARRIPVVYVTNAGGSRAEYAQRLTQMGINAGEGAIVTAGSAMVSLILAREKPGATAFVIGSQAFKRELMRAALQLCPGEAGSEAEVVAVAAHRGFNYDELRIAANAIRRGASFYAAGRDATYPMPDGPWPGAGSIVAAVETASGKQANVVGKPETYIFDMARSLLRDSRNVAVVGDHLWADIAGGKRAGLRTILVMTGTTTRDDLSAADAVRPDVVLPSLADLVGP